MELERELAPAAVSSDSDLMERETVGGRGEMIGRMLAAERRPAYAESSTAEEEVRRDPGAILEYISAVSMRPADRFVQAGVYHNPCEMCA